MEKKMLPGLDGIRALCALTVAIVHIDQHINKFSSKMSIHSFASIGAQNYAVTFFFVLSGFLITHLLLHEKADNGQIDLKLFYLRRILKIWPLYFLILIITLLISIFYHGYFWQSNNTYFIYYMFFIGNYARARKTGIQPIGSFWSIGVEEQFYLFWPLLIKRRNVIKALLIFLVTFCFLKVIIRLFIHGVPYYFIMDTRFSCMAIGGIGAWLYFANSKLLKTIFNPILQYTAWAALLSLYIKPFNGASIFNHEIYSLFLVIIIMNSAFNEKPVYKLDNKILNFWGKRSYGIYCWNTTITLLFCKLIRPFNLEDIYYNEILIVVLTLSITLTVSYLSYELFEKQFLKLKDKFGYGIKTFHDIRPVGDNPSGSVPHLAD